MDETYIKMCWCAKEIQELWKPKIGDNTLWKPGLTQHMINKNDFQGGYDSRGHPDTPKYHVWLPRQEDLQEIFQEAHGNGIHVSTVVNLFYRWFWDKYNNKQKDCCEQYDWNVLWLCFVMERLYGKYWNSKTESWEVIT